MTPFPHELVPGVEESRVSFLYKSVIDFLDSEGTRTRISRLLTKPLFVPELSLMQSAILSLKTFLLRGLPNSPPNHLGLSREDWFDEIWPRTFSFMEGNSRLDNETQAVEELISDLLKTADELWDRVCFHSLSGAL